MSKKLTMNPDYNEVWLGKPKPNPMFPDWMTERLRFLTYTKAVPCAYCGKNRKKHWTMFMAFKVVDMDKHPNSLVLVDEPTVYPPLTPVCSKHMMLPIVPYDKKEKTA